MKKRTGGSLGLIVPTAVAVIAAVIMLNMVVLSSNLSRGAAELNDGVRICRSIAECYLASEDDRQFAENLASVGYRSSGGETEYRLESDQDPEAVLTVDADGGLEKITVTAMADGREIYSLSTSKYAGRPIA